MGGINQHLRPGDTAVVEIDRTGASGDYIAYPMKLTDEHLKARVDGIHLTQGRVGMRAKVEITSVDDGYPAAKIIQRYPSQIHQTCPSSPASNSSSGSESLSTPMIDIDPYQFGLAEPQVDSQQHPSYSRRAAPPDTWGKQLRSELTGSWRT